MHPTLRNYLLLKAKVYVFCPAGDRATVGPKARVAFAALYMEHLARVTPPLAPRRAAPRRRGKAPVGVGQG